MAFRKHLGQCLVLLTLVAQIALAQHFTVHFQEPGITQSAGQAHDHADGGDEFKSIHILLSDLAKVLTFAEPDIAPPVFAAAENISSTLAVLHRGGSSPYAARAPPAFSA